MFYNLVNIISIDLSNFDLSSVISTEKMFYYCQNLRNIIFPKDTTITNIESMKDMFNNCYSLKELNLIEMNVFNVKNMKNMFYSCNSLESLNLSHFHTSKVINMDSIFYGCNSLISLDISNFDLTGLTNTLTFFSSLKNLNKLENIKAINLNISHANSIANLFKDNKIIKYLDLSYLDASLSTRMDYIFSGCINLLSLNLYSIRVNNMKNMEYAFNECNKLNYFNLSNLDSISSLENMRYMFAYCKELISLDLSDFQTDNDLNMSYIFRSCEKLEEINLGSRKVVNLRYH
jgi:surface protein